MKMNDYADKKIRPILEPMIFEILCSKPENPAQAIIKWLIKAGGYSAKLTKREEEELIKLREQVIDYRQDEEFKEQVENLMDVTFNIKKDKKVKKHEELKVLKNSKPNRKAFSAEVETNNKNTENPEETTPKVNQKTDSQISKIKNFILPCFLFNGLENRDINAIINSMVIENVNTGQIIMKEGETGNSIYIVEKGEFNSFQKAPNGKETLVKTYQAGDLFGNLALLYIAPRTETVKVKTSGTLFRLDRSVFNGIINKGIIEKRERYEKLLKKIDIFSVLDNNEITSLSYALKKCDYRNGDYIIRLGEIGKCIYIIDEGEAIGFGKVRGKNDLKFLKEDVFGEFGIIKDIPSKLNLQALTELKLLSIDRDTVRRIIGPIADKLKKKEELYKKYFKNN